MQIFSLESTKTAIQCVIIGVVLLVFSCDESYRAQQRDIALAKEYSQKAERHALNKEYKEAAEYYLKAAELGHLRSQKSIAGLYASGTGVAKDKQQSLAWFKKAAEQGDDDSQFELGCIYEAGDGVEKNLNEAARWFFKAAAQGYQYGLARNRYEHVIKMGAVRPTDLIEANRKAKEDGFLKKSAVWVRNKCGVAGLIMILIVSVFVLILLGRFDRMLGDGNKINVWVAPVLFAAGAVILWATEGFYAPGTEAFVGWLVFGALVYQSYQIVKTSNSLGFICLRIALTFIVSMYCFYAAAVATLLAPIILIVGFIKHILTPQSAQDNGTNSTVCCNNCKYYGNGYCHRSSGYTPMINNSNEARNCPHWKWENSPGY